MDFQSLADQFRSILYDVDATPPSWVKEWAAQPATVSPYSTWFTAEHQGVPQGNQATGFSKGTDQGLFLVILFVLIYLLIRS